MSLGLSQNVLRQWRLKTERKKYYRKTGQNWIVTGFSKNPPREREVQSQVRGKKAVKQSKANPCLRKCIYSPEGCQFYSGWSFFFLERFFFFSSSHKIAKVTKALQRNRLKRWTDTNCINHNTCKNPIPSRPYHCPLPSCLSRNVSIHAQRSSVTQTVY